METTGRLPATNPVAALVRRTLRKLHNTQSPFAHKGVLHNGTSLR